MFGQFGSQLGEYGAADEKRVACREGVMDEAGQGQLLAAHPATGRRALVEQTHAAAFPGEVAGSD